MATLKRGSREPIRLSRRLALQLALMTAVVVGATLGAGIWLIGEQSRLIEGREIVRARQGARNAESRRSTAVEATADAVVNRIEDDPEVLRQLIGRIPTDPDLAANLGHGMGLDVLELSTEDGLVVASLHWPERVGLASPYAADTQRRTVIDTPQGEREGWFVFRELGIGQQSVTLVAGRFLETDWIDEATALAEAGWWVPADGQAPLGSATAAGLTDLPSDSDVKRAAMEGFAVAGRWRLAAVPAPQGHIVLGLGNLDTRGVWRRLRGAWAGLTLAAALTAALVGLALGRRLARPVDQLVRAVDAIAAGEQDYSFAGTPQDEFDALAASFSRLQRSLEQQKRRSAAAERVAAWQGVAQHLAHEVKNPLAPIRLTVQNLQRAHRVRPEAFGSLFEEGAETILEEVEQLSRLVGEFSEFARLPVPELCEERIEPLLDEVLELFAADPSLTIVRGSAGPLPPLAIDRDQLSRVFKNVVGNSVEAMSGSERRELRVSTRAVDGYAEVSFEDRGPGFEGEAASRVFEPYFTTKPQGTGLGMAISYRVVAEHGGEIVAENRSGGGARVTVRLPL